MNGWKSVALVAACVCLPGCERLMQHSFDSSIEKARHLGDIDISQNRTYVFEEWLPSGDVTVGIRVRGYGCTKLRDGLITFKADRNGDVAASFRREIGSLSWSTSLEKCADGFGYARSQSKFDTSEFLSNGETYRVSFALEGTTRASPLTAEVWAIYEGIEAF